MKNYRDGDEMMMMRDGKNGEGMTRTKLGCKSNNLHSREFREDLCSPNFSPYKFFP
jgi:hypothetical protein